MDNVESTTQTKEQLLSRYNRELVPQAQALGLPNYKPLTRFRTHEDAQRKIETIESSIRAAQQSARAVEREEQVVETQPGAEQSAAAPEVSPSSESEDEMARKKKARSPRQRTKAVNGATLEAKTQEFNELVKAANANYDPEKKGSRKYKHHSSLFGSHENADKQLKAIRAQAK